MKKFFRCLSTVALLFSILGFVLILYGGLQPNFVDAYMIRDLDELFEEDHLIAGVGVFTAFYDTTNTDPEVVTESGIPLDSFTTDSEVFPLLFVAQENFVTSILPFLTETANEMDELFDTETIGTVLEPLQPSLNIMEPLGFDGCQEYVDTMSEQMLVYFRALQDEALPRILVLATNFIAEFLNAQESFEGNLELSTDVSNIPGVSSFRVDGCEVLEEFSNFFDLNLFNSESCDFTNFLSNLALIINRIFEENEEERPSFTTNFETLQSVYNFCGDAAGGLLGLCPDGFALEFLATSFSSALIVEISDVTGDSEELLSQVVDECELDVIDNQKMRTAQRHFISSLFFHCLNIVFVLINFLIIFNERYFKIKWTMRISSFFFSLVAFASATLTITALLTVRSAPIYDAVGLEPNGIDLQPIFIEGVVPFIALISAGFLYIVGICFLIQTCLLFNVNSTKEITVQDEGEEVIFIEAKLKKKESRPQSRLATSALTEDDL